MPECSISGCKNESKKNNLLNDGISYHRYPRNPDTRLKWIKSTGRKNWTPKKGSTICSEHFEENCFTKKGTCNRKYLYHTAVPTKNVFIENINRPSDNPNPRTNTIPIMRLLLNQKNILIKNQISKIKQLQSENRQLRRKIKDLKDIKKKIKMKNKDDMVMAKIKVPEMVDLSLTV